MELQVTDRTITGKGVKLLRKDWYVPAIVYWKAVKEPIMVTFLKNDFIKINRSIGLSMPIEMKWSVNETVIVKDYSVDPVTDELLHVDFLAVLKGQVVETEVPLKFVWESVVDKMWLGQVQHVRDFLHIEATPSNIPQFIEVDVTVIKTVNDVLFISDLVLPTGVTVLDNLELPVITVSSLAGEEPEEEGDDNAAGTAWAETEEVKTEK